MYKMSNSPNVNTQAIERRRRGEKKTIKRIRPLIGARCSVEKKRNSIRGDWHSKVENCYLSVRDWNVMRIKLQFVVAFEWVVCAGRCFSFHVTCVLVSRGLTDFIRTIQFKAKLRIYTWKKGAACSLELENKCETHEANIRRRNKDVLRNIINTIVSVTVWHVTHLAMWNVRMNKEHVLLANYGWGRSPIRKQFNFTVRK